MKDDKIIKKQLASWSEERIRKLANERRYKAVPVDPLVFADLVQRGIPKEMTVKSSGIPSTAICLNWVFVPISNTMLYYFMDESFDKVKPGEEVPVLEPTFSKGVK